tara:strand:+ start:81 stop:617 length:537 start_codon:yes stop_codon:yes gene_type:complete
MRLNILKLKKKTFKHCKITKKLNNEILLLKNTFWKHGIKSQFLWQFKNVKPQDVHNCLFVKKKLVGYTLLRKRRMFLNKKKHYFYLVDTVTISKKYRQQNIGSYLMEMNNDFLKKSKRIGFLLCKKNLMNFYAKSGWKKIKKNTFKINVKKQSLNGMTFNFEGRRNKHNKNLIYFLTN